MNVFMVGDRVVPLRKYVPLTRKVSEKLVEVNDLYVDGKTFYRQGLPDDWGKYHLTYDGHSLTFFNEHNGNQPYGDPIQVGEGVRYVGIMGDDKRLVVGYKDEQKPWQILSLPERLEIYHWF